MSGIYLPCILGLILPIYLQIQSDVAPTASNYGDGCQGYKQRHVIRCFNYTRTEYVHRILLPSSLLVFSLFFVSIKRLCLTNT
jgi:hypothetical protein